MKIYTTYFAKLKKLPCDIIPIAICGKSPNWYQGLEYKKLAPKYDFFMRWKKDHNNDEYIKCFDVQVLADLTPEVVMKELARLSGGKDVALVCYEKPTDFCHRHLVADWFMKHDISVSEWRDAA